MSACVATSIKAFSDPVVLQDGQVARGRLGKVEHWAPGLIMAVVGKSHIILPEEMEKSVQRHVGHKVTVLRCGRYSVRRG